MKNQTRQRARDRLDDRLSVLKPESRFAVPPKGWIRAIRDALGMTGAQLASRLGMQPQSVQDLERSEANATIQLKTLRKAAEALNCTVVYALVPNTSLNDTVCTRAREIALRDLKRVSHTMELEAQGVDETNLEARVDAYIRDVIRERDLWEKA